MTYKFLSGRQPVVDARNMVLVSTRQDAKFVLVFVFLQTDDTFQWIVFLDFGGKKDFDGQAAHDFLGCQICNELLSHPDLPE